MRREDFKILDQVINKRDLVYLDNAATTQKPESVINVISDYYRTINSNIHRGVHHLSQLATTRFEEARETIRRYINAEHSYEVIFTRGATESINLVANSFCNAFLKAGDEVIISEMEHHANIVPWQIACASKGAQLKVIPFDDAGILKVDQLKELISPKTKIISVTHISNSLGTINPIADIIKIAHAHNIPVMVDGAQAVSHEKVDVQQLDCDFYCFSGHKMYAPMGIGVVYGKEKWLNEMPPYQGGGEMIKQVTFEKTTYNELPFKFEAGTPAVAEVLGLQAAIQYIEEVGIENILMHEQRLLSYATQRLLEIEGIHIYGMAPNKAAIISFNLEGIHPYDVGVIIDHLGVAVRTGHHCTQPVMQHFQIPGTVRASFALYNTQEEVDRLVEAVKKAKMMLS